MHMELALIEAGAKSTSAAMNSCLLYLAAHPDAQRRAQDEIHQAVGHSRSPASADENQLPYIQAICKETLRIRPVASTGIPRGRITRPPMFGTRDARYPRIALLPSHNTPSTTIHLDFPIRNPTSLKGI